MNTPCPLCNHLAQKRYLAFVRREFLELARLEEEYEKHRQTCRVISSQWYLGLWVNAKSVVVVEA